MVPGGARNELAIQLTSALAETKECPAAGRSQRPGRGRQQHRVHVVAVLLEPATCPASSDGQARGAGSRGVRPREGEAGCLLRPPRNETSHSSLEKSIPVDSFPLPVFTVLARYGRAAGASRRDTFKLHPSLLCLSIPPSTKYMRLSPHQLSNLLLTLSGAASLDSPPFHSTLETYSIAHLL